MQRRYVHSLRIKKSSGAALVVALVLLVAVTVIGLANMQSASLETKMVASQKLRNLNFAIAESGLAAAEKNLYSTLQLKTHNLFTDTCGSKGTNSLCFTNPCSKGLCFDGTYSSSLSRDECEIASGANTTPRAKFWEDTTVWSTASKHGTVTAGAHDKTVKYIVEFLCFSGPEFTSKPNSSDALFRVTVLYEPDTQAPPIMLQSMYSFNVR